MSTKNPLIDSLLPALDGILGVRDSVGAVLRTVSILTRTWQGGNHPGEGTPLDTVVQMLPTPFLKDYSHNLRLVEGGMVRQGDIMIRNISKHKYPTEDLVDCKTPSKSIEKFYLIDDRLYTVISVKEDYVTWDVQVRKYSNQKRYGA
jgi:hypothetical protein